MDDGLSLRWAERRRQVARTLQRRLVAHLAAGGTTDFAPAPFAVDPLDEQLKALYLKQEFSKFAVENQGLPTAEPDEAPTR